MSVRVCNLCNNIIVNNFRNSRIDYVTQTFSYITMIQHK